MRNIKSVIIIITLIIGIQTVVPAQNYQEWHEKYWFYRYRFRQYFTDIGEGTGKSLVSDARNVHYKDDPNGIFKRRIGVGDQTIDLSWYLGILALESYQFEWSAGENDMTLTELYYALEAFKRLDMCENKYPWNKATSELDGFFMRFDAELIDNAYQHDMTNFNQGLSETDIFGTKPPGIPTYVDGFQKMVDVDWNNNLNLETESKHAAMSQDQAASMLMGLALVKKLAPAGNVQFFNTVEGNTMYYDFRLHAEDYALNITTYLKNSIADGIDNPDTDEYLDIDYNFIHDILQYSNITDDLDFGTWIITDPNRDLVMRGKDCRFARKGFIKACEEVTGDNISFSEDGFYEWEALAHFLDFSITPPGPYYNRIIWANLAVVGDSWGYTVPNPFGPDFEVRTTPGTIHRLLKRCSDKSYRIEWNSADEIYIHTIVNYPEMDTDHEKLYNLIWMALHANHHTDNYHNMNDYEPRIEEIMSSAPSCGPYSFAKDDSEAMDIEFNFDGCVECMLPNRAAAGWRSSNRFRNEPSEFNGFKYDRTGNYPGHDYMMLFNLYRKYRMWWYGENNGYGAFRNMIVAHESQTYPYYQNSNYYGSISNPANLRSFETFSYDGIIENLNGQNGCLNIRAGNTIKLEPGCHIKSGSRFSAKIEEYSCWEIGKNNKADTFYDNNYVQDTYFGVSGVKYSAEIDEQNGEQGLNESELHLFPNPANSFIELSGVTTNSSVQIKICDINGNVVLSRRVISTQKIDISSLSKGIYIAEIFIEESSFIEKIIKL